MSMRRLRMWMLVVGVVALCIGAGARGQEDLATDAERLRQFYASELEELTQTVGLTDVQVEAATSLYMEWARRTDIANKKVQAFYKAVNKIPYDGSDDRTKMYNDAARKQQQYRDKLRSALNADLQTLLTDEQMARWPLFDRDIRRRDWLSRASQFTGAGVDLVAAVRWIKKDYVPSETVVAILEEYKGAIDPSVRAIEQKSRAWMEVYWSSSHRQVADEGARAPEEVELARVARVAQGVNLRFARALLEALPPEDRVAVEGRLYEYPSYRTYSWAAYKRSPREVMQRAYGVAGLDEAHRAAMIEIEKEFEQRVKDFKRRLFEACVAAEADAPDENFRMNRSVSAMDPRVEAVVKTGDEIVAQFVQQAKLILTKEQIQQLGPPFVEFEVFELNLDEE